MDSRVTLLKFFVCPHITDLIPIMAANQLHFLANKNAELAGGSQ